MASCRVCGYQHGIVDGLCSDHQGLVAPASAELLRPGEAIWRTASEVARMLDTLSRGASRIPLTRQEVPGAVAALGWILGRRPDL